MHEQTPLSPIGAKILELAGHEAIRLYHDYLGTEHVLIALTRAAGGYTERMLERLQRRPDYLRAELRARSGVGRARYFTGFRGTLTPRLADVLVAAKQATGTRAVGERELLLALLGGGPGVAVRTLTADGSSLEELIAAVESDPGPEAIQIRLSGHAQVHPDAEEGSESPMGHASTTPILERYGRDLTAAARAGALHTLIGRRKELLEIAQALARPDRTVPVLVGEAGVGKSAIVEGFADRLAHEDERPVIPLLRGKRIIQVAVGDLVAGTSLRGDFEQRLQALLSECAAHPEIILFIDEFHTLVGAGQAAGSQDAAQLLKPALANGELRVIGATTPAEYQRFIARDAALERRVQPIRVDEPTPAEAEDLLRALAPTIEQQAGVRIDPEALQAAVEMSVRYLPNRRLPDKALDLLHDGCARVLVGDRLSFMGDLDLPPESGDGTGVLTPAVIAQVVAEQVGVPVGEITASERDRLLNLEQTLRRRVAAQDEAIGVVARSLRVGGSPLGNPNRPRAVLLFAGPTGVGKTETASALADALFAGAREQHLHPIDMAEFSQEHMIAQLIGAPPGYVGYEQEGRLTGWLRQHPYSVVLLDEIEKAHPAVRKLLLGLFDTGRLTDGQGHTVNGREAIYIMTTNWRPADDAAEQHAEEELPRDSDEPQASSFGHAFPERELRRQLGQILSPELVNRIDHVVLFRMLLDRDALAMVAQRQFDSLQSYLEARGVTLWIEADAQDWLIEHAMDPISGARSLVRLIDRTIREPVAELDLRGKLTPGSKVRVTRDSDRLHVAAQAPDRA